MDDYVIKKNLPEDLTIKIEDVVIGLIHGWGNPLGLRNKIRDVFKNVKVICYGHTHSAYNNWENDIYFFNPGSICGKRPSFGILEIKKDDIDGKIIYF
jgi:hypothetical protein